MQARIPGDLDEKLRHRAEDLGLSVSTIVRNVLRNTIDLVDDVVADSNQIARAVKGNPRPRRPVSDNAAGDANNAGVLGWQEVTLNLNAVCETCNAILTRGARACVGIPVQDRTSFLCLDCLHAMQSSAASGQSPQAGKAGE